MGQKPTLIYATRCAVMSWRLIKKKPEDRCDIKAPVCRYRTVFKEETMSRKEIYEKKAADLLTPILDEMNFELVDVEYVKEAGNWYLRGYIDKPGGITVNDCEAVSRIFSDKLDAEDFIDDSYIMEISSPGLDRPLKKEKDFARSVGKMVEIKTYKPVDRTKEFTGILTSYDDETVTIREIPSGAERKQKKAEETPSETESPAVERSFAKKDIALIRLAVVF